MLLVARGLHVCDRLQPRQRRLGSRSSGARQCEPRWALRLQLRHALLHKHAHTRMHTKQVTHLHWAERAGREGGTVVARVRHVDGAVRLQRAATEQQKQSSASSRHG